LEQVKSNEENLVKKTCKELGVTQKELAEMLEVTETTIMRWGKKRLDKVTQILLEGLLYKKKFQDLQNTLLTSI